MPGTNVTFSLYNKSSNTLKTIYYYVQTIDSAKAGQNVTWGSPATSYEQLKTVDTYFNWMTYEEEYHNIQGFTRFSKYDARFSNNQKSFSNNTGKLYYKRNTYTLKYYNVNAVAKSEEGVPYQAPLSEYAGYTPTRPSTVPEGYTFQGWYKDEKCSTAFNFNTATMPAGDLMIYAKWAAPVYDVTLYVTVGGDGTTIPVGYGEKIPESSLASIKARAEAQHTPGVTYTFVGWADMNGNPVDVSAPVYHDMSIYPRYASPESFKVSYSEHGKATWDDPERYASDTKAKVLEPTVTSYTADGKTWYFDHWEASGTYYPADKLTVTNANIILTAVYTEKPAKTDITYINNRNGDTTSKAVSSLLKNQKITCATLSECGWSVPDGWEFEGWSTSASATEATFAPGAEARLKGTTNKLYGIWKQKITVKVKGTQVTEEYDGNTHKATGYTLTAVPSDIFDESKVTYTGNSSVSRSAIGQSDMGIDISKFGYTDKTKKVTFELVEDGFVKINPITITITVTGNNATKDYTGKAQTVTGYTLSCDSSLYDVSKVGKPSTTPAATGTNAGTYPMNLTKDMFSYNDNNVTAEFVIVDGWLKIEKAAMTVKVTGHTDTKTYNGSEQTVTGYDLECTNSLYDATKVSYSGDATAKGTNADTYAMGLSEAKFSYNDNNINVTFNITDGWLKITPYEAEVTVTITGHTDTVTYDTTVHTVEGYDVTKISEPLYTKTDFSFSGTASASGTNADTYPMGLNKDQFKNTSKNFSNVTFIVTDGSLTIEKAMLTITADSAEKIYDGDSLTDDGWQDTQPAGLQGTDKIESVTVTGTITSVGTTDNVPSGAKVVNDKTDVTGNYDIIYKNGTLEVKKREITVTVNCTNTVAIYDGCTHTVDIESITCDDNLFEVKNVRYTSKALSGVDVMEKTAIGYEKADFSYDNDNFDVTFVVNDGSLTITKREITIEVTGETVSVTYDRTEHTAGVKSFTCEDALYDPDKVVDASKPLTGINVMTKTPIGLTEDNFSYADDNFDVTFVVSEDGSLEITPQAVTITVDNASKQVGKEDPEFTGTIDGVIDGDDLHVVYYRTNTENEEVGVYEDVLSAHYDENNNNYIVKVIPGDFEIIRMRVLTVRYWLEEKGGEVAAKTYSAGYYRGDPYNVTSPAVTGFTADKKVVKGIIEEDTEVDVIYTRNTYNIVIHYVNALTGEKMADDVRRALKYEQTYKIASPVIEDYWFDKEFVEGKMPAHKVEVTVYYFTETFTEIEDFGTPLSFNNLTMNVGDCFE